MMSSNSVSVKSSSTSCKISRNLNTGINPSPSLSKSLKKYLMPLFEEVFSITWRPVSVHHMWGLRACPLQEGTLASSPLWLLWRPCCRPLGSFSAPQLGIPPSALVRAPWKCFDQMCLPLSDHFILPFSFQSKTSNHRKTSLHFYRRHTTISFWGPASTLKLQWIDYKIQSVLVKIEFTA